MARPRGTDLGRTRRGRRVRLPDANSNAATAISTRPSSSSTPRLRRSSAWGRRATRDAPASCWADCPGAEAARAERAFLFTDICDSTPLVQAIGDEAWENLVAWHDRTLRALFDEHGGEEVDHAGDGFFVAFPDAKVAVECAVAVQRTLARHRRTNGFAPELRVGVHAAEASRTGAGYSGKGVHEAARIGELGGPGEITASVATANLVDGLSRSDPETVTLKGLTEPVAVVRLDWR